MADTQRSVKLRIVADAGTAKETLDDIAAKTDNLEGKDASVRINVNSGTTKAQLDEISAKAEALGIKKVTFSVKASTAVANAEIAATEERVDSLRDKLAKLAAEESAAEAASGLLRVGLLGLAPAALPIGAALTVPVLGLAPAFAAAGAGAGLFGLVAKSAITQVMTATGGLTKQQEQLKSSVTSVKTEWNKFVTDSAGGIQSVLAPALSVVPTLLKDVSMFLQPAESGLRSLAIQFKNVFESNGAQSFVQELSGLVAPAIVNLGDAAGTVFHGIGKLFQDLIPEAQPMEGLVMRIASAFDRWASSTSTANGIKGLFAYFNQVGPQVGNIFKELGKDIPKVLSALKGFGGASLSGISVILQVIGKLSPGQLQLIAVGILAIKTATNAWKIALIGLDVVSELNPWVLAFTAVAVVILLVVTHFKTLKKWAMDVFNWVKSNWPLLTEILLGPIGIAVVQIVKHWTTIKNGVKTLISDIKQDWPIIKQVFLGPVESVVNWFKGFPARVMSFVRGLPGDFKTLGINLVIGLWNGVVSLGDWFRSQISSFVSNYITGPFKSLLSIFSPSRVFHSFGQYLVQGLANGINTEAHSAVGAVTNLSRAVAGAFNPQLNASISGVAGNAGASRGNVVFSPTINVSGIVGDAGATGRQIVQAANEYLRQAGQAPLYGAA